MELKQPRDSPWCERCFTQEAMPNPAPPETPPSFPLIYQLEDKPPPGPALAVAFQHVAAMIVGTITPPLILAGILKFPPADTAYLVSMALLASALGTFLQTKRRGPIGSGLLSVTGTSFAFIQPLIQAFQLGGLGLMLGMSFAAAPLQILIAPFLGRLRRVFTPLVSGTVVLLIGLSLIPTAVLGMATPLKPGLSPAWNLAAVLLVLAVMLGLQTLGRGAARIAAILISVIAGWIFCLILGYQPVPSPASDAWFGLPRFLPHGFTFDWSLFLPFAFIYLVSLLEAMGDMTATAQLSGLPTSGPSFWSRLRGGAIADGLTSTVAALFGGFPSTTYAQNNGVIQMTGVASRRVGFFMAGVLAILGLCPAAGKMMTAIPGPVIGTLALMLFGLVAVSGLRLILLSGMHHRDALIVALSLGLGLGIPTQPLLLENLPALLKSLGGSPIALGGMAALVLNLILPGRKKDSGPESAD